MIDDGIRALLVDAANRAATGEIWFEIVVDIRLGASQGGLVTPGVFA